MMDHALRHLRRHWRINVIVLACLTLASALLAGFASYSGAVATLELHQNLDEATSVERNLLITGTRYTFSEALYAQLQAVLGRVLKDRLVIRHLPLPADPTPAGSETGGRPVVSLLEVYAFNSLSERVHLLDGRLPDHVPLDQAVDTWRPPPIEAVLGPQAAQTSGYGIGDRLTAGGGYQRLDIVGIVEPRDPDDDSWGQDLSAFQAQEWAADGDQDGMALPLIVADGSMQSHYPERPIFPHQVSWRVTLNHQLLTVDGAQDLHSDLINFQAQTGTVRATTSTRLLQILADFLARLSRVQMTLSLLTAQTLFFVLYTLATLTTSMIDRAQVELGTLAGRGVSAWGITRVYALGYLMLALPAGLLLGPGLAMVGVGVWSASTGDPLPVLMPALGWSLSAAAAAFGWLALVLPLYLSARRHERGGMEDQVRPGRQSAAQGRYLDLYLLAFGGLLYWQLNQAGSFVMSRLGDVQLADPLLLLGPSLLLIALAMLLMRVLPYLLGLIAWTVDGLRGLALPVSLTRMARVPLQPGRVVLLVAFSSGLVLFTGSYQDSLASGQQAMAKALAGADLRVAVDEPSGVSLADLTELPGVHRATLVWRGIAYTPAGQPVQLLAVDPASFSQVARDLETLTGQPVVELMAALSPAADQAGVEAPLPAISSPLPEEGEAETQSLLAVGGHPVSITQGVVLARFPTLLEPFAVLNLHRLEAKLGAGGLEGAGAREVWLTAEPGQAQQLASLPLLRGHTIDTPDAQLQALRSDALTQGTSRALQLNAAVLLLFSLVAFFLVHLFAAAGRGREFTLMRALGLSIRESLHLLTLESCVEALLGLMVGVLISLGLSQIMIPFLSQALADSLAGIPIQHVSINWAVLAQRVLLLAAAYGAATLALAWSLARGYTTWTRGRGDE